MLTTLTLTCLLYLHKNINARILPIESSILSTDTIPGNNVLPTIGNGYVALMLAAPWKYMYINGVFNGVDKFQGGATQNGTESHRAVIPSTNSISLSFPEYPEYKIKYELDVNNAIFTYYYNYSNQWTVNQQTYAHRLYRNLLITEITVNNSQNNKNLLINLLNEQIETSKDINFTMNDTNDLQCKQNGFICLTGWTNLSEANSSLIKVGLLYYENNTNSQLNISGQTVQTFYYPAVILTSLEIISPDNIISDMINIYNNLSLSKNSWKDIHIKEWEKLWINGRIDIIGNNDLAQLSYCTLYYILSSLRNDWIHGITPGTLANANLRYHGHVFWDQDIFIFPGLLLLHQDYASSLIKYRYNNLNGAYYNANITNNNLNGYNTAKYPWESAFTGIETNNANEWNSNLEIHLSASIAWDINQFYITTQNKTWLKIYGYPMLYGIANYFFQRMNKSTNSNGNTINKPYGYYEICGPDEGNPYKNNSGFTNMVAINSFNLSINAAKLLNISDYPSFWSKYNYNNTIILYDEINDFHPEFYGYKYLEPISVMSGIPYMGYPWRYYEYAKVNKITHLNDLWAYGNITTIYHTMHWTQFTINYLRLNQYEYGIKSFYNLTMGIYNGNKSNPFKIWNEQSSGNGCDHFITSGGGFLQTLIYGFAGIDIRDKYLEINLPNIATLSQWKQLNLIGIDYQYNQIDIIIYNVSLLNINITVSSCKNVQYGLVLVDVNENKYPLNVNQTVIISKQQQPARIYNKNDL